MLVSYPDYRDLRQAAEGEAPVVVLSHDLWRSRFRSDPEVLGRTLEINRRPFTAFRQS